MLLWLLLPRRSACFFNDDLKKMRERIYVANIRLAGTKNGNEEVTLRPPAIASTAMNATEMPTPKRKACLKLIHATAPSLSF